MAPPGGWELIIIAVLALVLLAVIGGVVYIVVRLTRHDDKPPAGEPWSGQLPPGQ